MSWLKLLQELGDAAVLRVQVAALQAQLDEANRQLDDAAEVIARLADRLEEATARVPCPACGGELPWTVPAVCDACVAAEEAAADNVVYFHSQLPGDW